MTIPSASAVKRIGHVALCRLRDRHPADRTAQTDILIALIPALCASVWLFGWRAIGLYVVCIAACIAAEYVCGTALRIPFAVRDMAGVTTGVLFACTLPPSFSWGAAAVGAALTTGIVTIGVYGIYKPVVQPAVAGRIGMQVLFPVALCAYTMPLPASAGDGVPAVSPLTLIADGTLTAEYPLWRMWMGLHAGGIGEVCTVALLLGGVYLLFRRVTSVWVVGAFAGSIAVYAWIAGQSPLEHLLSGGCALAVCILTAQADIPRARVGRVLCGVLAGVGTMILRLHTAIGEGVYLAWLLACVLTPLLNGLTDGLDKWVYPHGIRTAKRGWAWICARIKRGDSR